MNKHIENICNKICAVSPSERPPLVRELMFATMEDEATFPATLAQIEQSLGLLPVLDDIREDLRKERDPERIRGLMTAALRLRAQREASR